MNNSNLDLSCFVSFMQGSKTDFGATISITNPSPLTKEMFSNLPTNYTKNQTSGVYALVYGSGYEFESGKQTLQQAEANNYLYSPDVQQGNFKVSGIGKYLIEFNIPFTTPPLNVNIVGSDSTDVFIEFTSRFGMIINVQTDAQDTLQYRASGFVGAASNEILGDALYDNFGALYQFPRLGDSVINDTYVSFYENVNTFIQVESILPVQNVQVNFDSNGNVIGSPVLTNNTPPINNGQSVYKGIIKSTTVITNPPCTHELVDLAGNLIALLDAATVSQSVTSFYANSGNNIYKNDPEVYILGPVSTFMFDRWHQPEYIQEVFRGDNKYRRILSGINQSLFLGPTVSGAANMVEALIAQPFIDAEKWDDSDYRIFKNSLNMDTPKYLTYNYGASGIIESVNADSQYQGYPTTPPIVEVKRVLQSWSPDNITYNTKPTAISLDVPVVEQITSLNNVTRFDITNEITRQLRLGIDVPTGGIINWNYDSSVGSLPVSGFSLYENYNYVFLNNVADSITNINIFWYAQQFNINGPTGYRTFGPLQYGRDFFAIPTEKFLLTNGNYDLPSELLAGYNCNSNIPYKNVQNDAYGNSQWLGANLVNQGVLPSSTPALPQFVIQLDLRNLSSLNVNNISTKMPTNPYDFILYSYAAVSTTQASVYGNYDATVAANNEGITSLYYDADTSSAVQPEDTPFTTSSAKLSPVALAQTSFAKLITATGYEYVTTMIGGQISYSKTVLMDDIKLRTPINANEKAESSSGIFVMQALRTVPGLGDTGQLGTSQYIVSGVVAPMISSNGIRYFEPDYGDYVLLDSNGNPTAIFNRNSIVRFADLVGTTQTVTGVVFYTLWDTRIPVGEYRTGSPVFQALANFDSSANAITPDIVSGTYENSNFLVEIQGLPLGNQQAVTATWTFNILPTSNSPSADPSALTFSDRLVGSSVIYGVMSVFTGLNIQSNGLDPDNATYVQEYVSPAFTGYFINYNDYINVIGSKLSPLGDTHALSTLTNPILSKPLVGEPNLNTTLNFFNPQYGFISVSILPNQEFYINGSGAPVNVIRPNNNGLALQIQGDSYAGLVFYGTTTDKIVDKPTRLIADFTFASANQQVRKKVIEIDDGGYATFVDGKHPDTVQTGSVFYLAGNSFKYVSDGLDQATNQYSSNSPQAEQVAGQFYDRNPVIDLEGNTVPPIFETDPSQNQKTDLSNSIGLPGPPMRYRRPPLTNNSAGTYQAANELAIKNGYLNISPEKIAYIQFDFSSFPVDAIVNNGILEIYFASGFTIKQGKDIDLSLNKNSFWDKSRLSGNGKTFLKKLANADGSEYTLYQPLKNNHWRKNFFEIVIPYAFMSEPNDVNYGIRNLFSNNNSGTLPAPQNPQPNLEYLGFLNIDEIDTTSLLIGSTNPIENAVGLANIILSLETTVYQINGILRFSEDNYGNTSLANCIDTTNGIIYASTSDCSTIISNSSSPTTQSIIGQQISQNDILPNQKVLVFPFGLNSSVFFYGYVTSVLPTNSIGFTNNDISIYKKALDYVQPLYSEYVVKLLEADTYLPYMVFGKENIVTDTSQDIAY